MRINLMESHSDLFQNLIRHRSNLSGTVKFELNDLNSLLKKLGNQVYLV